MFPEFFGEIFLTNRYGVIIATSKKLTTLAHAHKYWWIGSYNEGKGRVFFDDRGYDESAKGYVLGIVVPVMQGDEILGILKCNVKILGPYSHSFDKSTKNKPGTYSLVRSKGLIVFEKDIEPLSKEIPEPLSEKMKNWGSNSLIMTLQGTKQIISYAPIPITKGSDQYGFGGSYKSIDHIKGNKEEGWYVVHSRDLQETIADSEKSTQRILLVGLILILLMAISALLFGRKIGRPVIKLAEMTEKVGKGDFKTEIEFSSNDELGTLAASFNKMIHSLRETTTSRDRLLKEISQRKQAENKSTKLATQLQQSKRMEAVGTMAGGIVHNFNNILTIILGNVEMAQYEIPENNPAKPYLKDTENAVNRAIGLIESIVTFSDQSHSVNNTIQPNVILHQYIDSIEDNISANITIEQKINPDTDPIYLESRQLKIIAKNLCINALWAMRDSGGVLGLTLESTKLKSIDIPVELGVAPGHFVKFSVSDTGHGIVPTDRERIFDPFFTTKEIGEGDGTSLSVVHGIVRKARGLITVESEVGNGATFNVFIPVAKSAG